MALEIAVIGILILTVGAIADRLHRMFTVAKRLSNRHPTSAHSFPEAEQIALIALEVATRMRSGETSESAWRQTWSRGGWGQTDFDALGTPTALVNQSAAPRGHKRHIVVSACISLATACRYSCLSGAPLADVLEKVAEGIGSSVRAHQCQERSFAAPLLSARVLAALPLAAVVGGELLGSGSVHWLVGEAMGRVCLVVGVALWCAGLGASTQMVSRARKDSRGQIDETSLCDLAAAGLQVGTSIPEMLRVLAMATGRTSLLWTSRQLVMGTAWEHAWEARTELSLLRDSLEPGWSGGASPVSLLTAAAEQTRQRASASVEESAAKLTVKLVIPLGTLLLPSFVCLGLIPVIRSLMEGQLGL